MNTQKQGRKWSRRGFLRGASYVGVGGAVAALADRPSGAATPNTGGVATGGTAYDLDRLRQTDPKLVHYEQSGSMRASQADPKRVVVGPGDQLYVTAGKYISVLSRDGGKVLDINCGQEVRSLGVGKDGAIYAGLRAHLAVYSAKGEKAGTWPLPAAKAWLTSLAVSENAVFAADASNRIVWRFDRTGKVVGRIGEKNKEGGIPGFLVPSPYFDLKLGADGRLWVANPGYHRLEAYTLDGKLESHWGEPSFGIAGFCGCCNPASFARLPDGKFVTSEKGLLRVKVYSPQGEFESIVASPNVFSKYFENPNASAVGIDVAVDSAGRVLVADTLGNEIRIYERKRA